MTERLLKYTQCLDRLLDVMPEYKDKDNINKVFGIQYDIYVDRIRLLGHDTIADMYERKRYEIYPEEKPRLYQRVLEFMKEVLP